VEEREDRKKEYKGDEKGTPPGEIISLLPANICLNILDTLWVVKKVAHDFGDELPYDHKGKGLMLRRSWVSRRIKAIRVFVAHHSGPD
jgi:hypothetical protein